jgi:threonine synthase
VNANRVFTDFLETGIYKPMASVATIANAMDVGDPSNFARVSELFGGSNVEMKKLISSYSYTDDMIGEAIAEVKNKYGYVCDPHGAVGYAALRDSLKVCEIGIFLETAHPAKFLATVEKFTNDNVKIPERLQKFMTREKKSINIAADYNLLKTNIK